MYYLGVGGYNLSTLDIRGAVFVMKKTLIALGTTATLLASVMAPTASFASTPEHFNIQSVRALGSSCYNSYDFDFTLNTRLTGATRAICEGSLNVSGEITGSQVEEGGPETNEVEFTVYKERTGPDKKIGSFTVTIYGENTASFNEDLGDIEEGNYYIKIVDRTGEGWGFSGSGTISSN